MIGAYLLKILKNKEKYSIRYVMRMKLSVALIIRKNGLFTQDLQTPVRLNG